LGYEHVIWIFEFINNKSDSILLKNTKWFI